MFLISRHCRPFRCSKGTWCFVCVRFTATALCSTSKSQWVANEKRDGRDGNGRYVSLALGKIRDGRAEVYILTLDGRYAESA